MLAVRLSDDLQARLDTLAKETGRSKSFYVRHAIESQIEDLEDLYLSESILQKNRSGERSAKSLDQVEKALGLAD